MLHFQFVLDVAMVVVYAFAVFTAEGLTSGATTSPAVLPESLLVVIAFMLYVAWDQVGVRMKRSVTYKVAWNTATRTSPPRDEFPMHDWTSRKRCAVTWLSLAAAAVILVIAAIIDGRFRDPSFGANLAVNALLWTILIAFRVFKEWVTPRTSDGTK